MELKPILKWPGGKTSIVDFVIALFPVEFGNYYEPFLGGASVAINVYNKNIQKDYQMFLSDNDLNLINFYQLVKKDAQFCIDELKKLEVWFNDTADQLQRYLDKRIEFNETKNPILVYFLNKTCFNGLVRYNSKGRFNAHYGKRNLVVDHNGILEFSKFLNDERVLLEHKDYQLINSGNKDIVYLDPPYKPSGISYSLYNAQRKEGFEIDLKSKFEDLINKGSYVFLSNHDLEFFRELFSGYKFYEIMASRRLGAPVSNIKKIKEIVISNY